MHAVHTFCLALLLSGCAVAASGQQSPQVNVPEHPALMTGAAWYPEQWPESRWNTDLQLMEDAHIHVVRIGEFAWSRLEPTEGDYQFDWLERAVALAGKHHIYVVMGTPTATPPAWLTEKYPETLRVKDNGQRDEHGNRLQYNFDDPKYREMCRDIVRRLAERFGHNPIVVGWQIDNEYSQSSVDPYTKSRFQLWLKNRYGTTANFNDRLTTEYWSEHYNDWSQVNIPHGGIDSGNPGLLLDWRRFVSDTLRSYQKNQIDEIRPRSDPRQFITTNTMGWFIWYDHYTTQQDLDMSAWDDYFPDGKVDPYADGATQDLTRGFKQRNYWIMETQPGFVNWSNVNLIMPRGEMRAFAWHAVGHGADTVSYWQWRSALNGQEQYHGVIVGPDGTPVPVYPEIQQIGAEFEKAGSALSGTHVESQVAVLHSYESRWAIEWQPQTDKFDPVEELVRYYRPLRQIAQSVDVVPPWAPLSKYKLVVAPAMNLLTTEQADNLIAYVNNGGNLVLGARSGMKDADNGLQVNRQPGQLVPLLGGRVEQFYALGETVPVTGELGNLNADIWADQLSTSSPDTRVVARYGAASGWIDGQPAIISRKIGKGSITYVGACFDAAGMKKIIHWLTSMAGVTTPLPNIPADVEVSERVGNGKDVTILVNFAAAPQTLALPSAMTDLLHGGRVSSVQLPKYGVAVLGKTQ